MSEETPIDVGEEKQVKKKKKKWQLEQEREQEELRQIINTKGGAYLLWKILDKCGIFHTLSGFSPHYMAIHSGRRDIGLELIRDIEEADKDGYVKLLREKQNRENNV